MDNISVKCDVLATDGSGASVPYVQVRSNDEGVDLVILDVIISSIIE